MEACAAKWRAQVAHPSPYEWRTLKSSLNDTALGLVAKASLYLSKPTLFDSTVVTAKQGLPIGVYSTLGEMLGELDVEQWQRG